MAIAQCITTTRFRLLLTGSSIQSVLGVYQGPPGKQRTLAARSGPSERRQGGAAPPAAAGAQVNSPDVYRWQMQSGSWEPCWQHHNLLWHNHLPCGAPEGSQCSAGPAAAAAAVPTPLLAADPSRAPVPARFRSRLRCGTRSAPPVGLLQCGMCVGEVRLCGALCPELCCRRMCLQLAAC